ncbi:MAG: mechanosensitive ion channel domain-containing protein [Pseudomonadales bacterium]
MLSRLRTFALCLLALCCTALAGEPNVELINAQQQLEQLDPSDKQNAPLRQLYQQIVNSHQRATKASANISALKEELSRLPEEIKTLKQAQKNTLPSIDERALKKKSKAQLELELTQTQAELLQLQQDFNRTENQISSYDQKPISLRSELADLSRRPPQKSALPLSQPQQNLFDIRFELHNLTLQDIELELLVIPQRAERDRLQLTALSRQIKALSEQVTQYQDLIQQLRQRETDALLENAPQHAADDQPAQVRQLIETNRELRHQLHASVTASAERVGQIRILEQRLTLIQQSYKIIQQQVELSKNSFGIELRNFSQRFASGTTEIASQENIAKIRLRNIDLNQLELDLSTAQPQIDAWDNDTQAQYDTLKNTATELVASLHSAYSRELDQLSKALSIEAQIEQQLQQGQRLLTEYLLWLPSVPEVSTAWPLHIRDGAANLLVSAYNTVQQVEVRPYSQWLRALLVLLFFSALSLLCWRYQKRHEKVWSRQIGNVVRDKFSRSLRMLLLAPIISLPLGLLCVFIPIKVLSLPHTQQPLFEILGVGVWLFTIFMIWLRRPYGLLISHLDVPEELCIKLKKLLRLLFVIAMPMVMLLIYFEEVPSLQLHQGLGRLIFMTLASTALLFWAALWQVAPQINRTTDTNHLWQKARLWLTLLVTVHLGLIVAALMGYLYTGSMIMATLLAVTLILFAVFTLYRLCLRWLLIAERRLAFTRARSRRNAILTAREKSEEVPPLKENYLDLQSISDQAKVLLKAACFSLMLVSLWLLLKNVLPSLDVLDNIVLWRSDVTTASGVISQSITLLSVITSLFVIGLSILAAYNLPGLLELLVLKHLDLSPGTSYAITTITRYLLIIVSIIAGTSQIGVEWSELQWLIAALGVGLGFGLQEIVANFVSGIIILFEKPVRIGDTVTIGGVTGKVTKIKIRATTIADWDQKEVIIPNKTFVTDQLINWSLSDAITRVVINLGVSHGSDTKLVQHLVRQAAIANQRILQEPIPEVFFLNLGDSALHFELRFWVDNLADRNLAIHEINQHIDQLFREHGVTVALPQLDVHFGGAFPGASGANSTPAV